MLWKRSIFFASVVVLIALAQIARAQTAPTLGYVPGRILVQFRQGVLQDQVNNVLASLSARETEQIPQIGVHIVQLPSVGNEEAFVNAFRARSDVAFAELDRIVPPADVIPNDPWYANWQLYLPKISAPTAWSVTTGSSAVTIAIVDTGVDGTHEDLVSKMVAGWNVYNNNSDTSDVYGHGTMVAGTAAAASNNGIGVASVCWNCLIMPVRVSATDGTATYSAIANGLTWAADHGARIANVSYIVTDSSTVTSAAQYLQGKGGVVTASAGNNSTFDSSPDNPYIITVSATDPNDVLYSWSNTGNNMDLAAPGCVYTTLRGGGYSSGCGTSFSAPIVAGVAGLVLSASPWLSGAQVTSQLQQTADDLGPAGWDPSYGWGRVNAARAVGASSSSPTVSFQSPQNGATVSGTASVQVSANDSAGIASVSFYVDNTLVGTSTISPYTWSWNTTSLSNGGHSLMAVAKDTLNNSSSATSSVTVSNVVADTTPPTIIITSPASGATVSGTVSVFVQASDNVGVVKVELYVDRALTATSTSAPFTTKWNAKSRSVAKGAHTLQTKAYDAAGNAGVSAVITVYK